MARILVVDDDPDIEGGQVMRTPDNQYLVEFLVEGTEYVAVRGLLDDIEAEVAKLERASDQSPEAGWESPAGDVWQLCSRARRPGA